MKIDYGTMTSPRPLRLSIGCTIVKPTIDMVWDIGFDLFAIYESFLCMTPEIYYTKVKPDDAKTYWEPLSSEKKRDLTLFAAIAADKTLQKMYLDVFRFFIKEPVFYMQGIFVILNEGKEYNNTFSRNDVKGIINEQIFQDVLDVLKQICGMEVKEAKKKEKIKLKNDTARKLFDKMQEAEKKKNVDSHHDLNLSLPNIISAVASKHPSINYTNIGFLTIYQVLDSFDRLRGNEIYDIEKTRVSVWGDEKNVFKLDTWYKNEYDVQKSQQ